MMLLPVQLSTKISSLLENETMYIYATKHFLHLSFEFDESFRFRFHFPSQSLPYDNDLFNKMYLKQDLITSAKENIALSLEDERTSAKTLPPIPPRRLPPIPEDKLHRVSFQSK